MKTRILLIGKDGAVAEYARTHAAAERVLVDARGERRVFKVQTILRLDERDDDLVVLYREEA